MKTKIVYVVVSSPSDIYLEQAWASLWSLKYYNPDAHVTFVTDDDTLSGIKEDKNRSGILSYVDEFVSIPFNTAVSGKERSRVLKTTLRERVKGDFLFIDTDTIITDSLAEIDNLQCHIGMVYDLHCKLSDFPFKELIKREFRYLFGKKLNEDTEQYNSGVIFSKDDTIAHDFYNKWHENWKESKQLTDYRDQPSLLKTCDEIRNVVEPLSGIYNCQIIYTISYLHHAKIIHFFNNVWKKSYISPFLELEFFLDIKRNGQLSEKAKEMIINCKSEFYTPTMPITIEEVQFGRSNIYRYLLKLFTTHRKIFNFFDGFFKIKKRIKKAIKLLCYYSKKKGTKKKKP